MPPKDKPSKKAVKEKQTRIIEDLTFGLKNKNKSKKVQEFINRAEKGIKNSSGAIEAVSILFFLMFINLFNNKITIFIIG